MKLISSKKTKRNIALMFVFAFMLSNLLMLFGPSAQAAITITAPSAGTCFQHSGTTATGALVTVYNIGTIQISLTAAEISPGKDTAAAATANAAASRATLLGSISTDSDVIGNVFTIVPPTGTNFVVVPGFQDTGAGLSNHVLPANATLSNAVSQEATTGTPDSNLAISVGVVTAGTAGIGRAIVAIARDADSNATNTGSETYPKSNTGSNTATISITGLGIAIPPSGDGALSGTLQATLDANPPSGIGLTATQAANGAATGTTTAAAAVPGLTGTINLCTVTSPAGELEAVLDTDNDSTDQYDKHAASANLIALGQISTATTVSVFDTVTNTTAAGPSVDLEPILIRGKAGTGSATRDQVFATGELTSDIDTAAEATATLDTASSLFGNSVVAPITVTFSDDNASATTTLNAVSIIVNSSTPGAAPAAAGLNAGQTSRHGALGALRAATLDNTLSGFQLQSATTAAFAGGTPWGYGSVVHTLGNYMAQETVTAAGTSNVAGLGDITANANGGAAGVVANEPFHDTFVDLKIFCSGTSNIAGWFAVLNSSTVNFGTGGNTQLLAQSQAGSKFLVSSTSNFYTQSLTNIFGTTPGAQTTNPLFLGGSRNPVGVDSTNLGNALLYASCSNNTLTLFPLQNGLDLTRDVIAITPRLTVSNVSNTFSSDINVIAQASGNNLSGTTTLNLAKLVGVPATGGTSTLVSTQGVAVSESSQLAVDCSSGGQSSVVLTAVNSGTVDAAATAACTSGAIASAPPFFTGGVANSVSGTTVIDGSPTVQGEARGILIKELSATGFSELVNQIGGGTNGTVFEVSLPSGCDVIDDNDDANTASTNGANNAGGNDVSRPTLVTTAGITASTTAGFGPSGDALTNANVLLSAAGATKAKFRFAITSAPGTGTDAAATDAVLVRLDAQDLFCPTTVTGNLEASVVAQNMIGSPTITSNIGTASLGTAGKALDFGFADDTATSTKGEISTNTMVGATPRLVGGSTTTANPFKIVELGARAIPIGGRVSPRNLDPENSLLSTVITRGQIWLIPADGTAFTTAPMAADVTFSDNSLVIDGNPTIVTSATVDANAPIGTLIIGVKDNTASGAADPMQSTTTITVDNLTLASATSSTTDLVTSVEFFAQDVGVIVNTPGNASANSASTPTVFSPYVQASTKALNQLEVAGVQIGTGSLANQLLTTRLTTQGTPQLNPFAKVVTTQANADGTKITVSSAAVGGSSTDNVVTVTGAAGAVDGGSSVEVTSGTTTYDSVTVVASTDGSFTAKVRGDCATATSVTVNVAEVVSGTKSNSVVKTALCSGETAVDEDSVFNEIAGSDGRVDISEVLSYVSANGGLAALVSAGGGKLSGVIKAAKSALGLS